MSVLRMKALSSIYQPFLQVVRYKRLFVYLLWVKVVNDNYGNAFARAVD